MPSRSRSRESVERERARARGASTSLPATADGAPGAERPGTDPSDETPPDRAASEARYDVFISYSWADRPSAELLYQVLTRYRRRWNRTRALRVFLDRRELPPGGSLPDVLRAAARSSAHLVYVASPDAAGSSYVAEELAAFIDARGADNIRIVRVRGHLTWESVEENGVHDAESALPEILRRAIDEEPSWYDLGSARKRRDADRFVLAQIVGAVHGLPASQVLRDEERARRRRYGLVGIAVALIAVLVVLASIATVSARRERNTAQDRARESAVRALVAAADPDEAPVPLALVAASAAFGLDQSVEHAALDALIRAEQELHARAWWDVRLRDLRASPAQVDSLAYFEPPERRGGHVVLGSTTGRIYTLPTDAPSLMYDVDLGELPDGFVSRAVIVVASEGGDRMWSVAGENARVQEWREDVDGELVARHVFDHGTEATAVSYAEDARGRPLLLIGDTEGDLAIWDAAAAQQLGMLSFPGHDVTALVTRPAEDGLDVLVAAGSALSRWVGPAESLRRRWEQPRAHALSIDAMVIVGDGTSSVLLSAGRDGRLSAWDLTEGDRLDRVEVGGERLHNLAGPISLGGRPAVAVDGPDGSVDVVPVLIGEGSVELDDPVTVEANLGSIAGLHARSDERGSYLVAASADGIVREMYWPARPVLLRAMTNLRFEPTQVAAGIGPDGQRVVAIAGAVDDSGQSVIMVRSADGQRLEWSVPETISALAYDPVTDLVVAGTDVGELAWFDREGRMVERAAALRREVDSIEPVGQALIAVDSFGDVRTVRYTPGSVVRVQPFDPDPDPLSVTPVVGDEEHRVVVSDHDSAIIVTSATGDDPLLVRPSGTPDASAHLVAAYRTDDVVRVAAVEDGAITIDVYSTASDGVELRLAGHRASVSQLDVAVLAGRPIVLSGDRAGDVRVWDLETGRSIGAPWSVAGGVEDLAAVWQDDQVLVHVVGTDADGSGWFAEIVMWGPTQACAWADEYVGRNALLDVIPAEAARDQLAQQILGGETCVG